MTGLPMPVPAGPPAATGKPPAGSSGGNKLSAMAKRNPQLVLGGAAVSAVILVALATKKSSGEASLETDAATAAGGQLTPNQGGYYDSTANDVYQSLMGQFVTLQQQVSELSNKPSTPTPPPVVKPVVPKPVVVPKPIVKKPAPKPVVKKPAPLVTPKTYTVKAGDNLSVIAARFWGKQDWKRLYAANKSVIGSNPNLIKPGQKLVIK